MLVSLACDPTGEAPVEPVVDRDSEAAISPSSGANALARPDTGALPYFEDASFTPRWLPPESPELESLHTIPPFELTNQEGQTISEQTFAGKVYIADFFFTTCPGICAQMTRNMRELQETFAEEPGVLLLSHSVTPEVDTVQRLGLYADRNGVRPGKWHLVTGDRDVIYRLGRRAYFADEDLGVTADDDEFLHTENFVLVDEHRHIRGIYSGLNKASLRQLVEDVRSLRNTR